RILIAKFLSCHIFVLSIVCLVFCHTAGQKETASNSTRLGYTIGAVFPAVKMLDHLLLKKFC
ncbi:hypothetical protein, partial [Streptococcus suis]|uniref:hypothetical protein n=1 Tax=Streptococcus suis TaxID=1307 RepID=UPI003703EECD